MLSSVDVAALRDLSRRLDKENVNQDGRPTGVPHDGAVACRRAADLADELSELRFVLLDAVDLRFPFGASPVLRRSSVTIHAGESALLPTVVEADYRVESQLGEHRDVWPLVFALQTYSRANAEAVYSVELIEVERDHPSLTVAERNRGVAAL